MKKLILLTATISALFPIRAAAETVTVGASPDPYEEILDNATSEELNLIASVVYYESARCCCPATTNRAVVETILNRVLTDGFPDTIKGVITQKGHFCYRNVTINNTDALEAIQYVSKNGRTVLPDYDYCFFATKKQSLAKNHVWIGGRNLNGDPMRGKGMWFGQVK